MVGRRIIYVLSLAGCLIFYCFYREWLSGFLLAALVFLPVLSLLVSLPGMLTARLEIGTPSAIPVGTPQELTLYYGSRVPTPPWRCRIHVDHAMTGQRWVMKDVEDLSTDHCGALICTIQKAKVFDYLGLAALPMRRSGPRLMLIRPRPVPMEMPDLERSLVKAWRPKRGGGFAENHELRLYRPGDSVQQIHWKLSAKTGSLILREPMDPVQRRMLLRMDLSGTPEQLDRKLGNLLWLGQQLLSRDLHFQIQTLTGNGVQLHVVTDERSLTDAIDQLLRCPLVQSGSLLHIPERADWQYYIGGDAHGS